ncbi:MAG: hypothetical protein Kow0047_14660 [Anaerolineae bacterium]
MQQSRRLQWAAMLIDGKIGVQEVYLLASANLLNASDHGGVEGIGRGRLVGAHLHQKAHLVDAVSEVTIAPRGQFVAERPRHIQDALPRRGTDTRPIAQR